jgi:hypothetical protein
MSIPVPVQSALTAAFVTLLIEYWAKPRLEARKDRVVRSSQLYQDLVTGLQMLRFETHQLIPTHNGGIRADLPGRAATLQHQAKELLENTRRLHDSLERINRIEVSAGLVLAHCYFGCLSDMTKNTTNVARTRDYVFQELGEIDQALSDSILALGPRSRQRRRAVRRVRAFVSIQRERYRPPSRSAA